MKDPKDYRKFFEHMFSLVDAFDSKGFAGCFTEQGSFMFANNPVITGRAEIEKFIAGFFALISGIHHDFKNCWSLHDRAFCNGEVTYTRKDGSKLTVPWATISRFEDGKMAEYLAYVDVSKLLVVFEHGAWRRAVATSS